MKRWLLPFLLTIALAVPVIVHGSFLVTTQVYTIQVEESLLVGPQTTEAFTLLPGNTEVVEVTVTNRSDLPLPIEIDASVSPPEGVEVDDPGLVSVPADALPHVYIVSVTADTDIPVQSYELTIAVKRE